MTISSSVLSSEVRHPRNLSSGASGSIHDDATATALGFRGGTVAGSIHMDQFPPLLLRAFGDRWFERGSLSMYFRTALTDNEPVQAFVTVPGAGDDNLQTKVWATTTGDVMVADGTAAIGDPAEPSALRSRDMRAVSPDGLRILARLKPGDSLADLELTPNAERQRRSISLGAMTEPLDWYTGPSPWGGPIASPSAVVGMLHAKVVASAKATMGPHVGLFGAIELRFRSGPVFLDRAYHVTGEVVALSDTPKTEVLWFDSRASQPQADGNGEGVVAEMRMMLRILKQSSPLYAAADKSRERASA